jgi:hypothetical protein
VGDGNLRFLDDHYDGELVDRHALTNICQCVCPDTSHTPLANQSSLVPGWFKPGCFLLAVYVVSAFSSWRAPDVAAIVASNCSSRGSSYAAFRHGEMETVSITRRAAIYLEWVGAAPVRPPFNLLALPCDALAFVLARIAIKLGLGQPPTDEELGQVDLPFIIRVYLCSRLCAKRRSGARQGSQGYIRIGGCPFRSDMHAT